MNHRKWKLAIKKTPETTEIILYSTVQQKTKQDDKC